MSYNLKEKTNEELINLINNINLDIYFTKRNQNNYSEELLELKSKIYNDVKQEILNRMEGGK